MTHFQIKEITIIYIFTFIFVLILSILPIIITPPGYVYVEVPPNAFSDGTGDLQHRLRIPGEPKISKYNASITAESIKDLPQDNLRLSITKMDSQGYRVWWNGFLLGLTGDPNNGNANIWNCSHNFIIDQSLIEENNILELEIHAKYDLGIFDNSIIITDAKNATRLSDKNEFFSTHMTFLSLGMTLFAMIIIVVMIILKAQKRVELFGLMMALIFISIYSLDYLCFEFLPISYLLFKKIIMLSLFLALLFSGIALSKSLNLKLPLIIAAFSFFIFLIGVLIIDNMLSFKKFYNIAFLMIPINAVVWLTMTFPKLKTSDEARIYFGGVAILGIFTLLEAIFLIYLPSALSTSSLPIVIIFSTMLTLFIALETLSQKRQLSDEIVHKNHLFKKTTIDELSGLYNKSYFMDIVSKMKPPFSIAMCDIDNFKNINDTYGHNVGDSVIKHVPKIINEILRKEDVVGRFGGDEFMMAIQCTPDMVTEICGRILNQIKNQPLIDDNKPVNITVSIGVYHILKTQPVELMLKNADIAMYKAKAAGRNRVVIFNPID